MVLCAKGVYCPLMQIQAHHVYQTIPNELALQEQLNFLVCHVENFQEMPYFWDMKAAGWYSIGHNFLLNVLYFRKLKLCSIL